MHCPSQSTEAHRTSHNPFRRGRKVKGGKNANRPRQAKDQTGRHQPDSQPAKICRGIVIFLNHKEIRESFGRCPCDPSVRDPYLN